MIRFECKLIIGLAHLSIAEIYSPEGSITLPSLSTDLEILKVARIEAAAIQMIDLAM